MINKFKELKKGQQIEIHSYKHDGQIHRVWKYGYVVEVEDDKLVVVNAKTQVIENNGRVWFTKEPAVCYFYTDKWYNIISMIRSNGIHYYCNIASPFIWDGEALKYIDYDLDLKVYPNNNMKVLDRNEYHKHAIAMKYPEALKSILEIELEGLMDQVSMYDDVFNREQVDYDFSLYNQLKEKEYSS